MKRRFSRINIEISNICNLQCSFCPAVLRTKALMDPALFARIIGEVGELTEQVCLHLMGDPLVHPRLDEFIAICGKARVPVLVVTNGVLLRPKQEEALLNPVVRQVNFSLHSFPDNFPGKDPSAYLERIFAWTERAFRERPGLYVNYRLWNLEAPQTRVGSGGMNREILARIFARFGGSLGGEPPDQAMATEVDVRRRKSYRIKERLYLHFDTEFVWPSLDLPEIGARGRCHGLSSHFGILVDGTVVPCCLDKDGKIPLGNVQERPVLDILQSPRAQAILRGFRERRLVEELCRKCNYIERFALVSELAPRADVSG